MEEIANQFKEEYTELLSRYKEHLTNAQIMSILQSVTRKQIGIKDNPERFKGYNYAKGFPIVDELEGKWKSEYEAQHITDAQDYAFKHHCSVQEIAEADCDGDIRHCKNACGELRMNKTTISDCQGVDRCHKD